MADVVDRPPQGAGRLMIRCAGEEHADQRAILVGDVRVRLVQERRGRRADEPLARGDATDALEELARAHALVESAGQWANGSARDLKREAVRGAARRVTLDDRDGTT